MELQSEYIIGDLIQTAIGTFLLAYFLADQTPRTEPIDLLEQTEEMLWFIAYMFFYGIALSLFFLLIYFMLYCVHDCFNKNQKSQHREIYATKATQVAYLYPACLVIQNGWELLG